RGPFRNLGLKGKGAGGLRGCPPGGDPGQRPEHLTARGVGAYAQLLRKQGIAGHVLEIGVHHGLSAIAVATLRGPGKLMFAVDLFECGQSLNISRSGRGDRQILEANMRRFHPNLRFLRTISTASSTLTPADLGEGFSFCHIDGGHSKMETYSDLRLCSSILVPGGIIALDDYFNPHFPGVCEGTAQFMLENPGTLRPLAIAYNKVLFQRLPASDVNADFALAFPDVRRERVHFWDSPAFLITITVR
ncbi:MAG: class I SAM-dependent methyltransferase, partial [Rhodospirillales bacterium]